MTQTADIVATLFQVSKLSMPYPAITRLCYNLNI